MKAIAPISIWQDGQVKTAEKVKCFISYDDLATNAQFTYQLIQEVPMEGPLPIRYDILVSGVVFMAGADYQNWDDSNEAAYAWVADQLNLTIVTP
jgi:hypothetical protein